MRFQGLRRWLTIAAMLALPVMAQAQEATLSGTVSDTTGGALPGVTVRAVHEASGNNFETVTDERGDYRLSVRIGAYRVRADLAGFAPVTRTLTLLVGQVAVVNLQMAVSGVQESVTVTGEAPLLDVTQSSLGSNIDSRQMTDLPVNGRSWTDLLMLAPGARSNSLGDIPVSYEGGNSLQSRKGGGEHATKLDGQPLTTYVAASRDLPQFSKDAVAEFEFVPSRGDATQGRSFGVHVNAVTKSGANTPSGSFSGYFRHDRFNAADPVAKRVLPYENQQIVGTLGGPIVRDRVHFFGYYERERQPQTSIYNTPFPHFNLDLSTPIRKYSVGGRTDYQFSSQTRLMGRANYWNWFRQGGGGSSTSPSSAGGGTDTSRQFFATLTQVLSSQSVNEIRGGVTRYTEDSSFRLRNPGNQTYSGAWAQYNGFAGPGVELQGVVAGAGGTVQWPNRSIEDMYSIRDDFTRSFVKGGRHTLKLGGEFQYLDSDKGQCQRCFGYLDATGGPVTNDLMVRVFPDLFDVSAWNLGLLSPISKSWNQTFVPPGWENVIPRKIFGTWVQDDWAVTPRLTLNLGVRYDLELNAFGNQVEMLPFLKAGRPDDTKNVGPRSGFTFSLNDRTVLRGGYGLYFGTTITAHYSKLAAEPIRITVPSDGRPDFASNPWNGPTPTYDRIQARLCTEALIPGCLTREASSAGYVQGPGYHMPYSHQAAIGLQRQIGATMAVDADYVYNGNRRIARDVAINLTYNPATGANYPLRDVSRRVWPWWGDVHVTESGGWSNLHSLQTALTKRFSQRWQGSATYTLSWLRDADPILPSGVNADASDLQPVPFPLAPDFGGEYTLAAGDQRHRAVLNGIWDVGYGFQLSGLYFFNSGVRYFTNWGVDLRGIGGGNRGSDTRLRPNGTIVPRNNFVGDPIHRVDLRLQQEFPVRGRARITGLLDVFNVLNHANYGSYVTQEVARNYGVPGQSSNVAFAPRTLQLGFKFTF